MKNANNKWPRCARCGKATYICAKRGCQPKPAAQPQPAFNGAWWSKKQITLEFGLGEWRYRVTRTRNSADADIVRRFQPGGPVETLEPSHPTYPAAISRFIQLHAALPLENK